MLFAADYVQAAITAADSQCMSARASIQPGPPTVPVKRLCESCCDVPNLLLYHRLMDAHEFNEHKGDYLPQEATESGPSNGRYLRRLKYACYTSHIGSLIWFLSRAAFCSRPALIPPAENAGYWPTLNDDADGAGHNLTETLVQLLVEGLTQGRAYLSPVFPDDDDDEYSEAALTNLANQKAAGALDARMAVIPAIQVPRWATDDKGNLRYVIRHLEEDERPSIFEPVTGIRHTWIVLTPTWIQEYTALQPLGTNGKPTAWADDAVATGAEAKDHEMGCVPFIPLQVPHVVRQLADEALSLFRTEAAHDWFQHESAYSQLVIASDKAVESSGAIVSKSDFALVLERGASATFASPNAAHDQSFDARESTKKNNIYMALQSLSLQTPSLKSGPRQSGDAKSLDMGQLQTICEAFAGSVRDCLAAWVRAVQRARKEESLAITITGLDRCDVEGLGAKLDFAERFVKLGVPPSAKRFVLGDLATSAAAAAPPEVKQAIKAEMETLDVDKPAPAPPHVAAGTENEEEDDEDAKEENHNE